MMQTRFKAQHLVHLVWKGSELFEMITVKMQPQTESCFTVPYSLKTKILLRTFSSGQKEQQNIKRESCWL